MNGLKLFTGLFFILIYLLEYFRLHEPLEKRLEQVYKNNSLVNSSKKANFLFNKTVNYHYYKKNLNLLRNLKIIILL